MTVDDDFFRSGEGPAPDHPDREAFVPLTHEAKCRMEIYRKVEQAAGRAVVFVRDLELEYVGVYKSSLIYRAARALVRSGVVKRVDVMRNRKLCIGLVRGDPWGNAFGHKAEYREFRPARWGAKN
jgi:hypothetical protein